MNKNTGTEQLEVVVVGAGQAGPTTGYHLARANWRFVILDASGSVGDA
jgi:putative flavoprotein involved in K+ transport